MKIKHGKNDRTQRLFNDLQPWKEPDRSLWRHALDAIDHCGPERESRTVVLTHLRIKDITSANWEANITRKNSIESSTMVARMTETLTPVAFNFAMDEMINVKVRMSNSHTVVIRST